MSETQRRRDYEYIDNDETIQPGDPVNFWESKQRELVTSVVDYNLGTLSDLIKTNKIDLSPSYQRRFRWDVVRQSRLIESFLMNVPIPPVFLNEDQYGQYSVIDGKQRLNAIHDFLRGRLRLRGLAIFSDINDRTFDDLPEELRTVIRVRPTLRAVIILRQSDSDIKFEVFQRLNTGGVRLNAQEIRNSTYPGPLNNLILDLSEHPKFHAALGIKRKATSSLHQEMRDAEFVLRFFTFRDQWATFSGGMRRQLDRFMAENQHMPQDQLDELRDDFLNTLEVVTAAFGEQAFRRWQPEKSAWRKQVLASLFDAQMFAARGRSPEVCRSRQRPLLTRMKRLFGNRRFRQVIDAATNTPDFFVTRIQEVGRILDEAGT